MPAKTPLKAQPYKLFGLCVSLIAMAGLTALFYVDLIGLLVIPLALLGLADPLLKLMQTGSDNTGEAFSSQGIGESIGAILLYFAIILAILVIARWRGGRDFRDLIGWQPWSLRRADKSFWLVGGTALLYSFAADFTLTRYYPQSENWFTMPTEAGGILFVFFLAVVFAPICEELLFRGWIYTSLKAQFGLLPALLVSSGIFAFLHYEETHLYALVVFPVGLALGVIRDRDGTKASASFHAFFNLSAIVLSFFGD